ncbi:MAG: hypothetical protein AAFU73_09855 [Planctomycetota bacterium]
MPAVSQVASEVVRQIFDRVASDLSMLADRDITVGEVTYEERSDRAVGQGTVHIAYRFGVRTGGDAVEHGVLLVPLSESIALAGYLMMAPDDQVAEMRGKDEVEASVREAMLEVGNFVAAAAEAALRGLGAKCERVIFEGCQGVRADVRPTLEYEDGQPLAVGRSTFAVAGEPAAEVIVMLPLDGYLGA